jgi:hypothetical protein
MKTSKSAIATTTGGIDLGLDAWAPIEVEGSVSPIAAPAVAEASLDDELAAIEAEIRAEEMKAKIIAARAKVEAQREARALAEAELAKAQAQTAAAQATTASISEEIRIRLELESAQTAANAELLKAKQQEAVAATAQELLNAKLRSYDEIVALAKATGAIEAPEVTNAKKSLAARVLAYTTANNQVLAIEAGTPETYKAESDALKTAAVTIDL